jgi:excisionase family DNA binding protein
MKITVEIDDDDIRRVVDVLISDLQETMHASVRDRLLSVADVAYQLRISRPKVYKLISTGKLCSLRVGASTRISASALEEFIAASQT